MKRIIALLLIAAVCVMGIGAFAEDAAPETGANAETATEATGFVFRDGITWGMSVEDVRGIEKGKVDAFSETGNVTALRYGLTDVSIFTADYLLYLFVDNKLVSAVYLFTQNWNDDQFNYLTGALTQLYGAPTEMTKEEITAESGFYPGFDGSAIEKAYGWTGNGVLVRIARDSEIDIFYLDPDFTYTPHYNTNGL